MKEVNEPLKLTNIGGHGQVSSFSGGSGKSGLFFGFIGYKKVVTTHQIKSEKTHYSFYLIKNISFVLFLCLRQNKIYRMY